MAKETSTPIDIEAARAKLESGTSREYWKGLEELAETEEFSKYVEDEFPERRSIVDIDRRSLLKFMGASLMLGGLGGCRGLFMPQEKIVPYVKQPEDQVPGRPQYYASTYVFRGYGTGVVVEQQEGRPTKIEGNEMHPSSLGKSNAFMQAAILDLYDPDRAQVVEQGIDPSSWDAFYREIKVRLEAEKATQGAGLALLLEPSSSPTLLAQLAELKAIYPQMTVAFYDPVNRDNVYQGARLAFGRPLEPVLDCERVDVAVALDGDFLHDAPGHVRYLHDFMARRKPGQAKMARLYAIECTPTLIGAMADHRAVCRSSEIFGVAAAIATKLGISIPGQSSSKAVPEKLLNALISDLMSARGRSLVYVGEHHAPEVHAVVHAINEALGNIGTTIKLLDPILPAEQSSNEALDSLIAKMNAGAIQNLIIIGGNPVYGVAGRVKLTEALAKVPFKVHHSLYRNETSAHCEWLTPMAHFLEAWSDARGHDGTLSVVQPLIAPLYSGQSVHEFLAVLAGTYSKGYDLVRKNWMQGATGNFESAWREILHDGVIKNAVLPTVTASVNQDAFAQMSAPRSGQGMEINFRPDPTIWDGRFANNGWLQELPKPLTTLTWDNAVLMSPRAAEELGVRSEDIVEISTNVGSVKAPVLVLPGHSDTGVTVHLGYGRTAAGRVGNDIGEQNGFNVYQLMADLNVCSAQDVGIKRAGGAWVLATCQEHHYMEGRDIVRAGTESEIAGNGNLQPAQKDPKELEESLFPDEIFDPTGYSQWAMAVDLTLCTGCNACITACQAENNIPVVGKNQVKRGREMHWMRIDRYYRIQEGDKILEKEREIPGVDVFEPNNIGTYFMPMMCQHCEKAPCEPVCPVAATVHSHEGLNQMVYNRCVGTRYCSNNCPYKVRRFNFLNYSDNQKQFKEYGTGTVDAARQTLRMINNPNVTVRGRGVMEKCTYCVQRINLKRIDAKREGRELMPNEVVTACQQACPPNAIVFGDMSNPISDVAKARKDTRTYKVLQETGSRPRTTYMVRVLNPNPDMGNA